MVLGLAVSKELAKWFWQGELACIHYEILLSEAIMDCTVMSGMLKLW